MIKTTFLESPAKEMKSRLNLPAIILLVVFMVIIVALAEANADDQIKIAAIHARSGAAAPSDAASVTGIHMAAEEINRNGGILGKRLEILLIDNKSTPIGASLAAEQAAEAGVAAIVSASWSSYSMATAKVAQAKGIPVVSNVSTHPKLTQIGDYIFRVCFTDDFQGSVMARFAFQMLNSRTAVILVDISSDYSLGLSEVFRRHFQEQGGRILQEVEYKHKQDSFDSQIQIAKQANADVLFLSGHDESGLIAKLAQEAGITSILLGGDGWESPTFFSYGGNTIKRGYYSTHWSQAVENERSKRFVGELQTFEKIETGTALAYDAIMLVADAIERAGNAERKAIREALAATKDFEGVTGTISLNSQGDPVKSAVIMEIKDGSAHYFKTINP